MFNNYVVLYNRLIYLNINLKLKFLKFAWCMNNNN